MYIYTVACALELHVPPHVGARHIGSLAQGHKSSWKKHNGVHPFYMPPTEDFTSCGHVLGSCAEVCQRLLFMVFGEISFDAGENAHLRKGGGGVRARSKAPFWDGLKVVRRVLGDSLISILVLDM